MKPYALFPIAFIAMLLAGAPAIGQLHYRFFYGTILTAEGRVPIANVNIFFEGSKLGSVTDQNGAFSFYIDTIPVFMIVSHLGFKTKRIVLDGTKNSMTLYMEKDVKELKEVQITANRIEPFFRDDHYTIRDYEIDSGKVYLLVYRNRVSKEELICKNLVGDTVARSGTLSFTPFAILKDCLGYLHVSGKDSVYQVYRREHLLVMTHSAGMDKYKEVLGNCVASSDQFLFFKKMISLGQGVQYYGIDRVSKTRHDLTQVVNEKKAKMLRRNPEDAWILMNSQPDNPPLEGAGSREAFDNWNWVTKALYRPIKTALYKITDFICIFDIPQKQLEFYDLSGNFSYKLKINVDAVRNGRWSEDIFLDETSSQVYTTFLKSTGAGLYRIDLNTGELHKILTIIHPFPQKIRIYAGKVYYLYDVLGDPDNKTLYRQDL